MCIEKFMASAQFDYDAIGKVIISLGGRGEPQPQQSILSHFSPLAIVLSPNSVSP